MSPIFRLLQTAFLGVLGALALSAWIAAAPVAAGDGAPGGERKIPALFGGPFTLIDHDGRERTERDFHGRFALIYFGYTYCPDICPTGLQTLSTALDSLGAMAEKVQPIFVSVDPERDRPAALKSYVANFHPRLIGLTGSERQVRDVARAYRVHRSKVILPDVPEEDYLVNHTSITYLMAPDGRFVTLFPHGTDADVMAKALRRHLSAATPS